MPIVDRLHSKFSHGQGLKLAEFSDKTMMKQAPVISVCNHFCPDVSQLK